jgi:hypothetical protein
MVRLTRVHESATSRKESRYGGCLAACAIRVTTALNKQEGTWNDGHDVIEAELVNKRTEFQKQRQRLADAACCANDTDLHAAVETKALDADDSATTQSPPAFCQGPNKWRSVQ